MPGGSMQADVEWQSNIKFFTKSTTAKLHEIGRSFQFAISDDTLNHHEQLGLLRWRMQERLGKTNYCATKALTRLYFAYLNYGRTLLDDESLSSKIIDDLARQFQCAEPLSVVSTDNDLNSAPARTRIAAIDPATVNPLMSKYHFLGYGRNDSLHLGMYCDDRKHQLVAAATLSRWDLDHATHVLEALKIDTSEVLVLSRLLSLPGARRLTLSQFIAQLNTWIRQNMRTVKMIVTYCNPNAGHYGTVYRGANFKPLCTEAHPFIPFLDGEYVSPRKCWELFEQQDASAWRHRLRPGAITPMPLLIYYYPLRLTNEECKKVKVAHCSHPYPVELTAFNHVA
jgi:hypothetical protein